MNAVALLIVGTMCEVLRYMTLAMGIIETNDVYTPWGIYNDLIIKIN